MKNISGGFSLPEKFQVRDTLEQSELNIKLLRFIRDKGRPAMFDELLPLCNGHPNTVRFHVKQLLTKGFVERSKTESSGRGRPASTFLITPKGRLALLSYHVDSVLFIEAICSSFSTVSDFKDKLYSIGKRVGRYQNVDRRKKPIAQVMQVLDDQGFRSTFQSQENLATLDTCPLVDLVKKFGKSVCSFHAGFLDGAMQGIATVKLIPLSHHGKCSVSVLTKNDI